MQTSPSPRVSVIIPCFNREKYIRETIGSVLAQSYPNIEIIAVDDGCTDNTRAILDGYGERVIVLEHPGRVNKGQSAAINVGIRACSGEYVAILDSDDLFEPEKIRLQVEALEQNPGAGLVYGNGYFADQDGNRLYPFYGPEHRETSDPNRILMDCYFLLPNNSLVRREVFERAGLFDESFRAAQDHDMLIRIMEVAKAVYIPDFIFRYRRHPDSISARGAERRWRNGFTILRRAAARYPYTFRAKRRRLAVLCFRMGQLRVEGRSWFRAALWMVAAGLLDPVRGASVVLCRSETDGLH